MASVNTKRRTKFRQRKVNVIRIGAGFSTIKTNRLKNPFDFCEWNRKTDSFLK
ncbi:hypothetical protein LEP1GSC161_3377 [Leptospira santarosai str. CBC1416]|uniref:Uncharacterized protein n=3 Tax=Leptospira santarosai TaxID=28183 RepID=A0A0E2BGY8_9LEPT|nr:hypothetical protein LEP1GSC179_1760 [Leptospira santarosai str. MOR084]EKO79827.1 hypothetical protein LEP1GSC068_1608 [Leptospira sp. Fiocruz LV3954]EKR93123.1 hypothetical protein LEP1GSC163_0991 [Leptospira santarosai str. CBC379]EKS06857.1 hypothetical protein LEP1GSC071_0757 [Leptospira santarosai str. JET]EMF89663.1 hypothetical protein LEP1GSC005_2536 [Leptospira santarosai str. ST188]EMI66668.1 hypothetical protein LEP1GSC076_1507 [Leptospira sp. Fiocruz LV4135]EMJ48491.1 hypothet